MQKKDAQHGDIPVSEFRKHGHELIDWIADYLQHIENERVTPTHKPGWLVSQLPTAAPEQPEQFDQILQDVDKLIMPMMTHWNHPRFMAYFASSASSPGILGELLSAAFNVNGMVWKSSPASTELEQVVMDWLRQLLGLPESFWGIIYDGASASSLHALAAATEHTRMVHNLKRSEQVEKFTFYASEYAHSSVDKAVLTLGFPLENLRKIETDAAFRMKPEQLENAISQDRKNGDIPCAIIATIGTTSVASIDPVAQIADICSSQNLWLHVDAAYGGAAALLPEKRALFAGWQHADSMVMNPHKWMFVPIDLSAFFTRHPDTLRNAFSLVPEYLRTKEDGTVRHQMDYGVQLGRRFRSLKLWFVLRMFGAEGMRRRVRLNFELAASFKKMIEQHPKLEIVAPVELTTVCFAVKVNGTDPEVQNQWNEQFMQQINKSGKVFLSHTKIDGRYIIRVAFNHLRTTLQDVAVLYDEICASYSVLFDE